MPAVLTDNAIRLLDTRYLDNGETVNQMWDRVSGGNSTYRNLLSELRLIPNSPALFNCGKSNGCTSSACFVFDVDDCMAFENGQFNWNSIMGTKVKAACVAKAGGGVGYYGGFLRPKGSLIKSVHRKACGPVSVLREYQGTSTLITQGGKRELAQMFVLPVWHEDIREFIHCKDEDPQALGSFNISVGWGSNYARIALDHPSSDTGKLWREQCESAWAHGCPGMFFPDTVNKFNPNPHLGLMNAPNPCGETPNRNNEPCSLASLVLARYFFKGNRSINWNLLEEDVWNGIYFMDDILDRNIFPHPDITTASLLTRKLGMGVMGWADLLGMMHIHYDSNEATKLASKLMSFIEDVSHAASEQLAKEKGPYPGYDAIKTMAPMRRNETTTSIAPTGSIYIIAGVHSSSIEPWLDEETERTTSEGMKLMEKVPGWIRDELDGFIPKTSHEIHPDWHIAHQAAFQAHTDLGVSKTINLPNSATVEDVHNAYEKMYRSECKGGTIYRDGSRKEQVLIKKGGTKSVYMIQPNPNGILSNGTPSYGAQAVFPPEKSVRHEDIEVVAALNDNHKHLNKHLVLTREEKLPDRRPGEIHKLKVAGMKFYLHTGHRENGSLAEIFISGSFGSSMAGLLNGFCMTFSTALQSGTPLEKLIQVHLNTRFEPCGLTNNKLVPNCTSIYDFIARYLAKIYLSKENQEKVLADTGSGIFCPECGTEAIYKAGCLSCPKQECGWSKCG